MMFAGCMQKASQRFALQQGAALSRAALAVRTNTTIAGTVYYRCAYHDKHRTALLCPSENVKWTYDELWQQISSTAGGLKSLGYNEGDVVATDLQLTGNSTANVLLQMAIAHNGMQLMTVKDAGELAALSEEIYVSGVVMKDSSSSLSAAPVDMKSVFSDVKGKGVEGVTNRNLQFAYYNTTEQTSNREVYLVGVGGAGLLEIKPDDVVCVAKPLNSALGMGAVICAMVRNATAYLPDMANFQLQDSSLIVCDREQVDMVRKVASGSKLRGGMVTTGNGDYVLEETEDIGGVKLKVLGSESCGPVMRPLFDACKDTYYSYK